MEDFTPGSDVRDFAKALYGWFGANAENYADERAWALRRAGDEPGFKSWKRVSKAAREIRISETLRRGRVLEDHPHSHFSTHPQFK